MRIAFKSTEANEVVIINYENTHFLDPEATKMVITKFEGQNAALYADYVANALQRSLNDTTHLINQLNKR